MSLPPASGGREARPGRRWHLVSMPWHALGMAPLALSLVRGTLARACPQVEVTEHFLNLRFAEYLLQATEGLVTPRHYQDVADNGIALGLGDWVFAGSLYSDPGFRSAEMHRYAAERGARTGEVRRMRALAGTFIEEAAERIAEDNPECVAFTTTFMQNVPSLALARRVKELSPSTVVIFGGANCDGPMGAALHRNHPFVDYVVRGEAELALPQLAERILGGSADGSGIDGLCWRSGKASVANPHRAALVPADLIPEPDYDAWHDAFSSSPAREYAAPYLVVEGSRGCWWGAKHHCTFCGIHDVSLGYRSRPGDRLWSELSKLVARYKILDIMTADNIMDPRYHGDLLPRLAESGWDLRLHFEMKANVTEEQVARLAAAGVVMVQFGIESLSTRVLGIMRKGMDGGTGVRVLRDAQDHGISVEWNYLYGFPGERDEDYAGVVSQVPALVHLQPPPGGTGTRIELQRFSPYYEDPGLGFPDRRPAGFYRHVYDLPEEELEDLAFYFDSAPAGISGDAEESLNSALAYWAKAFPASYLHVSADTGKALVLGDRREGWPQRTIELAGWQRTAYEALRRPRSTASLGKALAQAGTVIPERRLEAWLGEMLGQGLVFRDDGTTPRHVALATRGVHAKTGE